MTYSVIGNQVILASRIVDNTESGQTLISERIRSMVEHQFKLTRFKELTIKGKQDSIILYQVIGEKKDAK